jgi:peptidoglycan/LPS O-acetylase OafA/YrhL
VLVDDVVRDPGAADAEISEPTATYRPHLDGLRAVAVYLVLLFHAGSSQFSGGYLGVDVFFVLSGYLVTQLLLRDITARGSIGYGRFYARRFRRLLPAAFVVLIVTAVVFTAIAAPADVANAVGSFKAAFLYVTNWYLIHSSTGYFGADISHNPVLHFWSLAVEEQFYLVWPLALGAMFVLTRRMGRDRQFRAIRTIVVIGLVASAAWALSLRTSNPNRAYYGTDARAYELLAGALIALVPAFISTANRYRRSTRVATVVSVVAVVVLATSWWHLDAIQRGIAITIVTFVLIVSLEAADGGIAQRALSTHAMTYLGKISYGTYLWHWIVILVILDKFRLSTTATIALAGLVATGLSALSFEILEQPVRQSIRLHRHKLLVIGTGLTVSVVSAVVLIPRIVDPAQASAPGLRGATVAGFTPVPAGLDWRHAKAGGAPFVDCLGKPAAACTIVRGTGKHVFLLGDSHAWMLIPVFEEIARRENLTLSVSVRTSCPWQQDLYTYPVTVNNTTPRNDACRAQKDDVYSRVIPALHPDLVVVMEVGHEDRSLPQFLGPDLQPMKHATPAYWRWVDETTKRSVDALRARGRKVLMVEPIPVAPSDPLTCLSRAKVLEACRYVASENADVIEHDYRRIASRDDRAWSLDLDRLVCPYLPICDPVVDNQIVKIDETHLTARFAKAIAPAIDSYLKDNGLIDR